MKKLLTTLIGLAAFNVLADVIIYDNHLTYTTTGSLGTSRKLGSGWTVLDVQNGVATQLLLFKSQGFFYVLAPPIEIHHGTNSSGKDMMVVYVQPASWLPGLEVESPGLSIASSGLGIASGVSTSLNTGTQSYTGANMLRVHSSYVDVVSDVVSTNVYLQTAEGSLTFDSKTTVNQNQIDGNYTNTVQRLIRLLGSEGYTEGPLHLVSGHIP